MDLFSGDWTIKKQLLIVFFIFSGMILFVNETANRMDANKAFTMIIYNGLNNLLGFSESVTITEIRCTHVYSETIRHYI